MLTFEPLELANCPPNLSDLGQNHIIKAKRPCNLHEIISKDKKVLNLHCSNKCRRILIDVTSKPNYVFFSEYANFCPRPLRFGGQFANSKGSKVSIFSKQND
jgi:hypothetical protein